MKAIVLIISSFFMFSQQMTLPETFDGGSATFSRDTICMNYDFVPGDTLYYQVEASDSIIVNYGTPILRIRKEFHRIVIDSVNKFNRYHISHTMLGFKSKEVQGNTQGDEMEGSTMKDVTVNYEIDGAGKRYSYGVKDSATAIVHPGGAFNPPLLFDIGIYCQASGVNWTVKNTIELPENGVPFPLLRYTHLFRFQDKLDTLGHPCNRLEYTRVGMGSYNLELPEGDIKTTSKINGFGLLDVSEDTNLPIHHYCTTQQKIDVTQPSGKRSKIQHFTEIFYTLDKAILVKREEVSD